MWRRISSDILYTDAAREAALTRGISGSDFEPYVEPEAPAAPPAPAEPGLPDPTAPGSAPAPVLGLDGRSKADLVALAEALGLDASGTKATLRERVETEDPDRIVAALEDLGLSD